MLRFQDPLTPAAREILVYCLEVAADEILDLYEDHEAWAAAYPLSSACFSRELARRVLLEVLDKLDAPEVYVPTDYHFRWTCRSPICVGAFLDVVLHTCESIIKY